MLKITKGGNIFVYNDKEKIWEANEEPIKELAYASIENICELEEGVTFGDIFLLIEKHSDFFIELFNDDLTYFLDEINSNLDEEDNFIEYLEICWNAEEIDGYLEEGISLTGWGKIIEGVPEVVSTDEKGNVPYLISFFSLNKLKDIPIYLNNDYEVVKIDSELMEKYINGDKSISQNDIEEVVLNTKKHFTLIDIIDSIFFEISIHGSPDERDSYKEDLFKKIEEIKEINDPIYNKVESIDSDDNSDDDTISEIDDILNDLG